MVLGRTGSIALTSYALIIVLATFNIGLALGNMVLGWLANRIINSILLLINAQIAAALLALYAS